MLSVFRAQAVEARLALILCWVVMLGPTVAAWVRVGQFDGTEGLERLFTALALTATLPLMMRIQLAACRGGAALRQPWVPWVLAGLTIGPMLWGTLGLVLSYAVAAAVLLYSPLRATVLVGLTCLGFLLLYPWVSVSVDISAVGALVELLMLAAIVVAVSRLAVLLDDLQFTREVLARRRVDVERERVGRDLHDVMGRTLVAASLRNQAVLRTLEDRDPEATRRLERLHETLARGQVQLRALTGGPTIARLDDELATARMLCERMNIALTIDQLEDPPGPHEALVGLVIRENITNVLKHSRASTCRIVLDRVDDESVVSVDNDGGVGRIAAGPEANVDSRLRRAVSAAGGTTESAPTTAGGYRTVVRVPLPSRITS